MTRKQIEEQIEKLENRKFYLNMKDRWNREDYKRNDDLNKQLRELKEELKNVWKEPKQKNKKRKE